MRNHLFRFKQFSLSDDKSLMKIGTDSVLLGAWIGSHLDKQSNKPDSILDIGTGSGVIALMLAQKTHSLIDAVEIDTSSSEQAKTNIESCKLEKQITVYNESFGDFIKKNKTQYTLIVTNPPFFSDSLKSPDELRNLWRHNDQLTYEQLVSGVRKALKPDGFFYLIIPFSEFERFYEIALMESLYVWEKLFVKPKPDKAVNRILLKMSNSKSLEIIENTLTIRNMDNSFTEEYKKLTQDYYLDK